MAAVSLAHLTVIDIATLAAAPQVAAFFGDFGARVIKVEHPRGDPLRQLVDDTGAALQWKVVNRNKLCASLDLAQAAGRRIFDQMLSRADLLVSALPPARLARWELDRDQLHRRHPRLVAVNLTTFGLAGPWRDRPGSGTLAEATTGLAHLTGPADAPPTLSPVGLGDYLGVLQGIIAALLGLYERDAHGAPSTGAFFDVAMCDPLIGLLGQRLAQVARSGLDPGRNGNRFPTMAPRNAYHTADGFWVALTAGTDDLTRRLFGVIGRPELAQDPRFRDNSARIAHVAALDAIIAEWIAAHRRDDVVAAFTAANVSVAGVDDTLQVLANEHFLARGNFAAVEDPEIGRLTTAAPLPLRTQAAGQLRHLGRPLGADNHTVYVDWLGLDHAELEALRGTGVV